MPDDPDPLRGLRERERDGERALVEIGPFTALMLIAALQTAHDYPLFRRHGRALYWQVVAQLKPALPDDPVIQRLISEGEPSAWRTDY